MYTTTQSNKDEKEINKVEKVKQAINVLLIEDSPADVRLVKEHLKESEHFEFNITQADSVKKAISIIREKGAEFFDVFDVVILDLGLPDCVGISTLKMIKNELVNIPIIIRTGSVLERNDLRYCLEGSSELLVKGYTDSSHLENAILSAINKQKEQERIMRLISHPKE